MRKIKESMKRLRQNGPLYKRKGFWLGVTVVAIVVALVWTSYSSLAGESDGENAGLEGEEVYGLFTVRENDPALFEGKVEATTIQEVYFDSSLGKMTDLQVEEGTWVEEGSHLFSYTNQETQTELDGLNLQYARLLSQKEQVDGEIANAKNALDTAKAHIADTNKKIDQHLQNGDVESALYERTLEQLQEELATFENNKMNAEATIESSPQTVREYTNELEDLSAQIEALRGKITTQVNANTNGLIQLNEEGLRNPEVPYIRIVSEEVKIEATVSEYDYEDFSVGMPVSIRVLNSDRQIEGSVSQIGDMPVEVEVEGSTASRYPFTVIPEESIHYGYSVEVGVASDSLYIPYSVTIDYEDGKATVFVYEEGSVSLREIEAVESGNLLEVVSGLEVGEQLVYDGYDLEDGQKITVDEFLDDGELEGAMVGDDD
jgi:HlyD family secretion protein